jgi:hypothetical protein
MRRLGVPFGDVVLVREDVSGQQHPPARSRPWYGPIYSARRA